MSIGSLVLLLVAGAAAGLVGYISGLASLVSYPALLAVGLNPLLANTTNTLAQVGAGMGATLRAGRQVWAGGRRRTLQQLAIAAIAGAAGGALLVATGESSFGKVAPWLILFASLMMLASPHLWRLRGESGHWAGYLVALVPVCLYGGYFGAGAGVVFLAAVLMLTTQEYRQSVLMKSVLLAVSNLTASIIFICFTPVDWLVVAVMFVGQLIGGSLGPAVQRHVPNSVSRWVIAVGGVVMACWLWMRG